MKQRDSSFLKYGHIKLRCLLFCVQTDRAHSWTCMDLYVIATPYRVTWDYYYSAQEHTLEIKSWEEKAEMEYVRFY